MAHFVDLYHELEPEVLALQLGAEQRAREEAELARHFALPPQDESDLIARLYLQLKSSKKIAVFLKERGIKRSAEAYFTPNDIQILLRKLPEHFPAALTTRVRQVMASNGVNLASVRAARRY